jgi:hypothetical protein
MRLAGILISVGLLAGCGMGDNAEGTAKLCTALARDLAGSGLAGAPTLEQARATGKRLDARVTQPAAPALHEAVISLHQRLHALEAAHRRGGASDVTRLAGQAHGDVRAAAKACHVPVDRFTG